MANCSDDSKKLRVAVDGIMALLRDIEGQFACKKEAEVLPTVTVFPGSVVKWRDREVIVCRDQSHVDLVKFITVWDFDCGAMYPKSAYICNITIRDGNPVKFSR